MVKQIHFPLAYLLGALLLCCSCTKNFVEVNTDPSKLDSVGKSELPFLFSRVQSAASNSGGYQTSQNLNADMFAQYFSIVTGAFQTDRYGMRFDWMYRHYTNAYVTVMPQLEDIMRVAGPGTGEYALANVMWVQVFHRLTDLFGPIPYFQAGSTNSSIPYDPQDVIYDDFFKRLDTAAATLSQLQGKNIFSTFDLYYNGEVDKWIKFTNTLRLRLALRISNVDPQRAKKEAEAAVRGGVMTEVEDGASIFKTLAGNDYNNLAHIAQWNEFRMSSTIYSYLKGYKDPRLDIYYQPSIGTGKFASVRNGLTAGMMNESQNSPNNTSSVGQLWVKWNASSAGWERQLTKRQEIMETAEAYFLRAEGALNGWNMDGQAKDLYEKGIESSMRQWGITDAAAINSYIQSVLLPAAPDDYQQSAPVADIPVRWGITDKIQRQQIGTQKWLALFPDGMEAWADIRRSDYLVQYPIVARDPSASVPAGEFIKRLPYPVEEAEMNNEALQEAISKYLGGADQAGTRLWWDVK
jgi:hypothetical protein